MDIHELRYFISTYETGSYARAAEKLSLSRQALRQKLQRLEEELNGPLFLTGGKNLEPTDLGVRLYQEAHHVVSSFDSMELNMLSHARRNKNRITMAMGFGAATFLSQDLLLDFQQKYPQIELNCSENSDTVALSDVASGRADLGIIGAPSSFLHGLNTIRIQKSKLYLYIPKENPLSQKDEIQIPDLAGQPFISFGPQNHAHQFLTKECQAHGFTPNFLFCIQDSQAACAIAKKSNAITWSFPPDRIDYARPDFTIVPLNFSDHTWGTYIISRLEQKLSLSAHLLIQYLCAHATDI